MGLILVVGVVLGTGCASSAKAPIDTPSGVLRGLAIDVHEAPG